MHIYGILKNGTDEPICKEGMETQMQRMDVCTQQGKERAGRIESSIDICIPPCVKHTASGELLCTGSPA